MQNIRISEIIAQPHLKYFNSMLPNQLDHGGRAGYKSSKNAIKIAYLMLLYPTIEAVIIREDYSDHKNSTFRDMIIAFKRLGVQLISPLNYPQGNDLWIRLPKGNMIHFAHMKDIDKLKGYRPSKPGNTINIVYFVEITQFKEERYITEAKAGLMREAGDWFISMYEWNDAPKLSHWTYDFLDKMKRSPDAYVQKTNYNDAPEWQQRQFLGQPLLNEIRRLKEIDFEQFKSTYLGFPANLVGTVYKNFNKDKHIRPAQHDYIDIILGVDFGGNDATVAIARGILEDYSGMDIIDMYYHKNGVTGGVKNINEYKDDILTFASTVYAKYKKPITLYLDSANNTTLGMLIEEATYTKDYAWLIMKPLPKLKKRKGTRKEKRALQERIDVAEIMFGADYVHIDPVCKPLIKAIEECEYNDNGERADDGRSDMDSIDAFDYSWIDDMDIINDIILR